MKNFASFLAVTVVVLSAVVFGLTLVIHADLAARSLWISAAAVVVVQAVTFSLMRLMQPTNVMAGYALGFLVRIISLVVFGAYGVKAFGLSLQPALLGMAGFFFISTLIEPFFLKPKA